MCARVLSVCMCVCVSAGEQRLGEGSVGCVWLGTERVTLGWCVSRWAPVDLQSGTVAGRSLSTLGWLSPGTEPPVRQKHPRCVGSIGPDLVRLGAAVGRGSRLRQRGRPVRPLVGCSHPAAVRVRGRAEPRPRCTC